jgi:hypothetical protein
MANYNKAYGAGLKNAWIRDANGVSYDINAILKIDASNSQNDVEVKGDDAIKITFSSERVETLKISANGLTFDMIAAITGNTVSSSATGLAVPQGTNSELSPPFVEVGGQVNGKSDDGTVVVIQKVWHKVQLGNVSLAMENEKEFSLEADGTAYQTAVDVTGAAFAVQPGVIRSSTVTEYNGSV